MRGAEHVTIGPPLDTPALPSRLRDAEILTVAYRSTAEAVVRLEPAELTPVGQRVLLHFYRIRDAGPYGSYSELQVQVAVEHPKTGTTGGYSPMMFLESDSAIATGRELFGQRKKAAEVELAFHGDLLVARPVGTRSTWRPRPSRPARSPRRKRPCAS
jgi:acetoacetate decarboxylase